MLLIVTEEKKKHTHIYIVFWTECQVFHLASQYAVYNRLRITFIDHHIRKTI